jgi:hypothetical protein
LVEETATSVEALEEQTENLNGNIAKFKVGGGSREKKQVMPAN